MIAHCPSCQTDRCSPLFVKNGCRIRSCRSCGTWFVADPPSAERLRDIYGPTYFAERLAQHASDAADAAAQRAATANARRRLALIRRSAPRGRRLLDVGCGTGTFLSVARESYQCCGVDVSAEAVAVVRERLGVEAYAGDLIGLDLPGGKFDVITLFDVIEHVLEPGAWMQAVRRLLAPRGVVVVTTGDTDSLACRLTGRWWHLMTPPEHLTFFSRRGLTEMMTRSGLAVEHVSHQPVAANVGYMAAKLADVVGWPTRWLPRAVSLLGLGAFDMNVNLLDVLTLVARRGGSNRRGSDWKTE